jgi:hypothetical protein
MDREKLIILTITSPYAIIYDALGNILITTGSLASTIGAINPIRYLC